jgi:hypothetical protein
MAKRKSDFKPSARKASYNPFQGALYWRQSEGTRRPAPFAGVQGLGGTNEFPKKSKQKPVTFMDKFGLRK